MDTKHLNSERGQVLVLVVLGIVAFLGFTALAIDGSMVYSDRRFAQNSADASSLAGGASAALTLEGNTIYANNWDCNNYVVNLARTYAVNGAIMRAQENGFVIDPDPYSDNHGVDTACGWDTSFGWPDPYLDVRTFITNQTKTTFAHFVFNSPLENQVRAVTRVRPRTHLGYGHAIVALNDHTNCSNEIGATFSGGGGPGQDVFIDGGGIFTNGCLRGAGNIQVDVINGGIYYHYKRPTDDLSSFSVTPQTTTLIVPPESYNINDPDCTDPAAQNVNGSYLQTAANNGTVLHGLYCIAGEVTIQGNGALTGNEVTLFLIDGKLTINATVHVNLTAPPTNPNPSPAVPGLLIYLPSTNSNAVTINGTSDDTYTGTILAPASDITLAGTTSNTAFHSQIIGFNVKITGTSDTYVVYNQGEQYTRPPRIDLYR